MIRRHLPIPNLPFVRLLTPRRLGELNLGALARPPHAAYHRVASLHLGADRCLDSTSLHKLPKCREVNHSPTVPRLPGKLDDLCNGGALSSGGNPFEKPSSPCPRSRPAEREASIITLVIEMTGQQFGITLMNSPPPLPPARIVREKRIVTAMIELYCRSHHGNGPGLCGPCERLLEYARCRLDRCRFRGEKTPCVRCPCAVLRRKDAHADSRGDAIRRATHVDSSSPDGTAAPVGQSSQAGRESAGVASLISMK